MHIFKGILIASVFLTFALNAGGQNPKALPEVVQHTGPIYPALARQTRIQGDVRVKITTDGASVRDAEAETGHALLRKAAEENARTWKFVSHSPGVFHVTFRYKLLSDNTNVEFLESPGIVQIVMSPPDVIIDYLWVGLGTWKAQLKSAHGKSWQLLRLAYSGPDGDWLNGSAQGPKGGKEEIDFGHKEENFLAFTIMLNQADGRHVKTFFIGRMMGSKMVGTFVDDAGIRGEWTASRLADNPEHE